MSDYHHHTVMAILDNHLYKLRKEADDRLDRLTECGCYFCGRRNPEVVVQFLCEIILRIPVCKECNDKGCELQTEDFLKYV